MKDSIEKKIYNIIELFAQEGKLQIELDGSQSGYKTKMILDSVLVYGVENEPKEVLINNRNHFNYIYNEIGKVRSSFYDGLIN